MFRTKRNHEQTQGQLFKTELGEAVDHARAAAGYAAGGMKAAVAPTKDRVRGAAKRVRVRTRTKETKVSQRRVPKVAGLLALGALVGTVTAVVLRRRRQQHWEGYDPTGALAAEAELSGAERSGAEQSNAGQPDDKLSGAAQPNAKRSSQAKESQV